MNGGESLPKWQVVDKVKEKVGEMDYNGWRIDIHHEGCIVYSMDGWHAAHILFTHCTVEEGITKCERYVDKVLNAKKETAHAAARR